MVEHSYGASDIKILEGLEAVRKRPAMYIGTTSKSGLHHLVYEVLDNSIDEALAGYCTNINVVFNKNGSVSVTDDGRGIPIGIHKDKGVSAAEVVLTVLHAGGKFEGTGYKVSGGLHGVGVSCVNALSNILELEVYREGKRYTQTFNKGIPAAPGITEKVGGNKSGTTITFYPDDTIFEEVDFEYSVIATRSKELAYLNKGLRITLLDEREEEEVKDDFKFDGGIVEYIKAIDSKKEALLKEPFYINKEKDNVDVEVTINYSRNYYDEHIITFVNNIKTKDGGTHLSGFRTALTRSLNSFAKKNKVFKGKETLTGNDVREGLSAIISVKVPDPQFEGQTKGKLGNSEVRGIVDSVVAEGLELALERDPNVAKAIIQKAILAANAREAARKAQDLARRKNVLESTTLPGKLSDCTESNPELSEIFIVEGDSAGGSAKQGRDRFYQAILPLRGKIINVEKARLDKLLANEEVKSLITAIGPDVVARIDRTEDLEMEEVLKKVRYHKIVIMTDADVDGAHIRTLLLTFFYRYAKELVSAGLLYVAQPPLFLIKKGNSKEYVYNEEQKKEVQSRMTLSGIHIENKDNSKIFEGSQILTFTEKLITYKQLLLESDKHLYNKDLINKIIFDMDIHRFIEIKKWTNEYNDENLAEISLKEELYLIKLIKDKHLDMDILKEVMHYTDDIKEANNAPYELTVNGEKKEIETNELLVEYISRLSSRGITIQRYKGLGEMNPEQLWETTMDPKERTLLRIKLEDAEIADEIFTILMGSEVAPRKQFIEEYAKKVKWLDV